MNFIKVAILSMTLGQGFNSAYAMSKLNPFKKEENVKVKMDVISKTIKELTPLIVSEKDFIDDKNKKFIETRLKTLTGEFETLTVHPVLDSMGVSLNQAVITEELYQTQNLFNSNKKTLARAKFTALLNLCVSCHVQFDNKDTNKMVYSDKDLNALKISDFEKAEMLFISRDYKQSVALYDKIIMNSKKADDEEFVYQSLGRLLFYYVKINKNFAEGKIHFNKIVKAKVLTTSLELEVKDWAKALGKKSLWDAYNPATTTEDQMKKFMGTFINDEEEGPFFTVDSSSEVLDLNLSSILLDYYNAHADTKLGGQILYWLGILDKRLNNELFFSLGDYYFLSCMEKYPKEAIAQDCYDSYVQELEVNYLSKENKKFPQDVITRLERLQKLINYSDAE